MLACANKIRGEGEDVGECGVGLGGLMNVVVEVAAAASISVD